MESRRRRVPGRRRRAPATRRRAADGRARPRGAGQQPAAAGVLAALARVAVGSVERLSGAVRLKQMIFFTQYMYPCWAGPRVCRAIPVQPTGSAYDSRVAVRFQVMEPSSSMSCTFLTKPPSLNKFRHPPKASCLALL